MPQNGVIDSVKAAAPGLGQFAATLLKLQTHRHNHLGDIEEPAFNMLLDLLVQAEKGRDGVSISSLGLVSGLAATTALRWIHQLEQRGLVTITGDPDDRRRRGVRLSEQAMHSLVAYLQIAKTACGDGNSAVR